MSELLESLCEDVRHEAEQFLSKCQDLEQRLRIYKSQRLSVDDTIDVQTTIAGNVKMALFEHKSVTDHLLNRINTQKLCRFDVYTVNDFNSEEVSDTIAPSSQFVTDCQQPNGFASTVHHKDLLQQKMRSLGSTSGQDDVEVWGSPVSSLSPSVSMFGAPRGMSSIQRHDDYAVYHQTATPPNSRTETNRKNIIQLPTDDSSMSDVRSPKLSDFRCAELQAKKRRTHCGAEDGSKITNAICINIEDRNESSQLDSFVKWETSPPALSCSTNGDRKETVQEVTRKTKRSMTRDSTGDGRQTARGEVKDTNNGPTPAKPRGPSGEFYARLISSPVIETKRFTYKGGDTVTVRMFEGGGTQLLCGDPDVSPLNPPDDCLATAERRAVATLKDHRHGGGAVTPTNSADAFRRLASATHVYAKSIINFYEQDCRSPVVYESKVKKGHSGENGRTAADVVLAQPNPVREAFRRAVLSLQDAYDVYSDGDQQRIIGLALEMLASRINTSLSRHFCRVDSAK